MESEVGKHCRRGRVWADLSRKFHNEGGIDERDWSDLLLTSVNGFCLSAPKLVDLNTVMIKTEMASLS